MQFDPILAFQLLKSIENYTNPTTTTTTPSIITNPVQTIKTKDAKSLFCKQEKEIIEFLENEMSVSVGEGVA